MKSIYEEISALNKSDLLPRAKALYLALMELADRGAKCKAILASLVFKSGMSESSVIRATKELEASGFISVFRFDKRGPKTLPNIYTLLHRTDQSHQIDSTCPVKLTSKNNNHNKEGDTTTPITTSTACHPDTRGEAPSVRDDRLQKYIKILDILKEHDDPPDQEAEFRAFDVVELIGLQGLESELRKRRTDQPFRKVQWILDDIIEDYRNASRNSSEVA